MFLSIETDRAIARLFHNIYLNPNARPCSLRPPRPIVSRTHLAAKEHSPNAISESLLLSRDQEDERILSDSN